jgi:hypothetical protein
MPFNLESTFPARAPDVQVFFHGLLMLIPKADGTCQVGVHRLTIDHQLSVGVRVRGAEAPDPPLLRLSGPLDSTGLNIRVFPPTQAGVKKFEKDQNAFDRSAPLIDGNNPNGNDPRDFRWCVDLQNQQALPAFDIDPPGISPSVTISDGLFHAARLTDPSIVRVQLIRANGTKEDLSRVARIIGANIYLEANQKVVLEWFADGKKQTLDLPKIADDRTAVINIDNSPSLMPSGKPDHSEFIEYFKVTNVDTPFDVDFDIIGATTAGTDLAPCMSVPVGG